MAKRQSAQQEVKKAVLVMDKEQFISELRNRIEFGKLLLDIPVQRIREPQFSRGYGYGASRPQYDEQQFDHFKNEFHKWTDYNSELLKQAFDIPNNEYQSSYVNTGQVMIITGNEDWMKEYHDEINQKIVYLESLIDKVPLLPTTVPMQPVEIVDNKANRPERKIFISHNTEDADFAAALVDLLVKIGVDYNNIFCSSYEGCHIPFGNSILNTISSQFNCYELCVLFIHSKKLYASPVSLNEMGAAWILRAKHFSFLTKECVFDDLKGVITKDEAAFRSGQENTYHVLNDFRREIESFFSLSPINDGAWEMAKKRFIKEVE